MTTIDKMVDTAQKLINTLNTHGADLDGICYLIGDLQAQINDYSAEKTLLEKTQDWHEHGMIAPSCVGGIRYYPRKEAIEAWNTRHQDPPRVLVDADKLEEVLEVIKWHIKENGNFEMNVKNHIDYIKGIGNFTPEGGFHLTGKEERR